MIIEGIHINAIYKHWKGDYYRVQEVAFYHENLKPFVVYYKCNENGTFKSIRQSGNTIVSQPFMREVEEFLQNVIRYVETRNESGISVHTKQIIPRFQLFKQL